MRRRLVGSSLRRFARTLLAAGFLTPLIGASVALAQTGGAALTFSGVEAIASSTSCTAFYTDNEVGASVCSVYTGTVVGTAAGSGPAPAIINMTITGLDQTQSNPSCLGMYINVQFAGDADSQTLFGFGSLCSLRGARPRVQFGARLTTNGGYGIVSSQTGASGTGQFTGTLTPQRGAPGESLVMTFTPSGQ